MIIFSNDWGETATTKDEIIRKNIEHMNEEDLVQELRYQGITDEIIAWALRQTAFHSDFDGYIETAERNWAVSQGWWEEEEGWREEECFEPGRPTNDIMALNP